MSNSGYIVNAAPMVIQLGTQDLSTRQLPREAEAIPQHCPKFFLFAQKGPTTPQLVVGAERTNMYGDRTFDLRDSYATHATVFANLANAQGNSCMLQRVIPEDAGPKSNITMWLDVLPTKVDLYKRNTDGSIYYDASGAPTILGQADGFKIKWVSTNDSTDVNLAVFGAAKISAGDQVDTSTGTQSQRYPIFELAVATQGAYGNNCGFRMWAPTTDSVANMPTKMMSEERAYPFYFAMIERETAIDSPTNVESLFGEQYTMVTMKPGVIDPNTEKQLYMGDILLDSYQNLTDVTYPIQLGNFGSLAIYEENLATLLAQFHAAEKTYIDDNYDFSEDAEDIYLFNFLSGVTSNNVPYQTYQFVDDSSSLRLSQYSNIYAAGGSDGTMTNDVFASLVETEMARYLDANDEVQEVAVNVESIMYDSGFPLSTKYALCKFVAQRKDTFVILSTHTDGGATLTASEEYSLAIALRTRLQNYPESDYFGTAVMRGMIIGRSGKLRNSLWTKRLPLSAEVLIKSAKYMGAGNGYWKNGSNFDGAPGSVIDSMYDISITWVPCTVRNKNWDAGLNWVQAYDRRSFFFPALKTVYDDDTSVLNSYFTAMAIAQLNKVAHKCWREYSGVSGLTNAQLIDRVNAFVTNNVKDRFDSRYVVVPDAFISDMDELRGYSWTLPIKIYSPNMKTVMITSVQAYRISDLDA